MTLSQIQAQMAPSRRSRRRSWTAATAWSPTAGQSIDHYHLIEQIEGGSMGLVYRATNVLTGEVVALKVLPVGWDQRPGSVARFLRSARAVSALNHPNICRVQRTGTIDNGTAYIEMELCNGETLKQRAVRGPLEFGKAIDLCIQVAAGLEAAHAAGIVHRDIKPANIMICRQNGAKILDFGLAKLLNQIDLTRSGSWVGTPAYMAPEQMTGQQIDRRIDLWALGATLYELLTERFAFNGDNPAAVMYAVLNLDPEPVTTIRPDLPVEVDRFMERSLAKSPAGRYSSAHEMIRDLSYLAELVR